MSAIGRFARIAGSRRRTVVLAFLVSLQLTACGGAGDGEVKVSPGDVGEPLNPSAPAVSGPSILLKAYDGTTVPTNKAGEPYPSWSDGRGGEGGVFTGSIDTTDSVRGNSFKARLVSQAGTGNLLYAQFNPHDGVGREFARTYVENLTFDRAPTAWQFNTYNRMTFWIKAPAQDPPIRTDGQTNAIPAPNGIRVPPGYQGYNGMFYDTTALPLTSRSVLYLAIRPLANNPQGLFAQVVIPLAPGP